MEAFSMVMAPATRKWILVGLYMAASCHLAACSDVEGTNLEDVRRTANTRRSLESVASAIRSSMQNHEVPQDTEHRRRETQQQKARRSRQRERRTIVGGTATPPGRFPYVVSLQLEKVLDDAASAENDGAEVSDVHTCGGTLVAMDVVLTAGHCGYEELDVPDDGVQGSVNAAGEVNFGQLPSQIFYGADVGAYDLANNDGGGYAVDNMLFEKLILHPDYTGFHGKGSQISLQHDVMLVKLYGASDQPVVRLHNPQLDDWAHRAPREGDGLVVVGWGDTDPGSGEEHSVLASVLREATVNYVPNDQCEDAKGYSSIQSASSATKAEDYFEYDGTISADMMCARGDGEVVQDACQGDSGGGLLRLGADFNGEEDVQMGIVSWGLQCGDRDFPGVYARVGEHYDWIAKKLCELSDSPPTYLNCPAKAQPPGSPYDPVVALTITLRFDDFRSETGWLLESMPDFRNIVFRGFDHYKSKTSVDENNSVSETISIHAGRFYMLSILDEFADGFCCNVGEGYFRVEAATEERPLVDTTPGILWSPHALRRAFYLPRPDEALPPNYVTVVVTLGVGADPGKFLLVALENVMHEALLLYEIRPFVIATSSRAGAGTNVFSRTFRIPVFGADFKRQRYHVLVYDDNEPSRASFEVYEGDAVPENLILAQSGNYEKNNVSRSFVLFKKQKAGSSEPPVFRPPPAEDGMLAVANDVRSQGHTLRYPLSLVLVMSLRIFIGW